ncbi:MAG: methyltransferase, TrmH family [Nocardioidaceae bacterium]|nr:methyltransferase, TrmH family [Nocardioidaceae bacterium]
MREALRRPGCVVEVFATAEASQRHRDLQQLADEGSVGWQVADRRALASLTDTRTPQGIVAVCRAVDVAGSELDWGRLRLVAVCADDRDPGNAGSLVRCADAAGADAVVLAGRSVDPYNPKAVRASTGSLFHVPVTVAESVEQTVAALRSAGLTVLAADGAGDVSLDELDAATLRRPTGWVFGNEAWGIPAATSALADAVVRVPIYGRAESLNLATAAALCLYASARRQRDGDRGGRVDHPQA